MSKRQPKIDYWHDAPMPRGQLVLFADTLEQRIPEDHPVRILDEILSRMDWTKWEAEYNLRHSIDFIGSSGESVGRFREVDA